MDEEVSPRERARSRVHLAIEQIEPFKRLYDRFVGNKLPAKAALTDAIKEFEVTPDAAQEAVDTFIVNLKFVGLLTTLSGADRIVTIDHLLDSLPGVPIGPTTRVMADVPEGRKSQVVTSEHAHFETTCFYISPIGEDGSEQRRHADLFLISFVEPALDRFGLKIVRADAIDKPGVITRQVIDTLLNRDL